MELDPVIWAPLTVEHIGKEVSLRLHKRKDDWVNPLTGQCFDPIGLGAACGICMALHSWQLGSLSSEGVFSLLATDLSTQVIEPPCLSDDLFRLSEVCAGLGGITQGGFMTGIQPHVALEISPFTCAHLSANHYPKVLQGDLASKADVGRFHQAMGGVRSGLCAGFPCQPFSSMGAQLHFSDPRASVFFRVLDAAYLVQSSYLILECVPGVQGLRPITQALDRFCEVMSFHWTAKVLHLDRALPSRRTRWWLVALPTSLNLPKLSDLPLALHRQTLGQLVRQWPTWPKEEERELKLTQSELDMYQDPAYGVLPRLLDMNGVAPTLLHSAGHHLVDCPCGCRGPISDVTLRARGWQAIVVNSNYSDIALRHVHHNEAAFLVGAPFGLVALGERKALLPLLGQIASPIQAHWILAQVLDANGMLGDRTLFDAHERVMNHHVQEHLRRWPTRANQIPRQISIVFERDPVLHVTVHESVSVRALLEATGHHIGAVLELRPNDAAWLHPQGYVPPGPLSIAVRMIGQGKRPFSLAMDDPAVIVPRDGLDDYTIHHQAMRLFAKAGRDDFVFFTPRFVAHLLEVWSHFAQQEILRVLNGKTTAIGVLWDCGHWIAFRVEKHGSQLEATSFDGVTMEATADMAILFQRFQYAFNCQDMCIRSDRIVKNWGHPLWCNRLVACWFLLGSLGLM